MLNNNIENILLKEKNILRRSLIPDGTFMCSNQTCHNPYAQYIDKMEIENRLLIQALNNKINKLEKKINKER